MRTPVDSVDVRKAGKIMNLYLVLTHYWYDEIEAGRKRVEYRNMADHWKKQIWDKRDKIKTVTFARGYSSTTQTFAVTGICVDECPIPNWTALYYCVSFEDITA